MSRPTVVILAWFALLALAAPAFAQSSSHSHPRIDPDVRTSAPAPPAATRSSSHQEPWPGWFIHFSISAGYPVLTGEVDKVMKASAFGGEFALGLELGDHFGVDLSFFGNDMDDRRGGLSTLWTGGATLNFFVPLVDIATGSHEVSRLKLALRAGMGSAWLDTGGVQDYEGRSTNLGSHLIFQGPFSGLGRLFVGVDTITFNVESPSLERHISSNVVQLTGGFGLQI